MNFIGICLRCAKDEALQRLIREHGSPIERCEICEGINQLALPASNMRLKRMFRALVRWNYFEWEHAHGSANYLVDLFDQENSILTEHVTQFEDLEFVLGELISFGDQTGAICTYVPIARTNAIGTGIEPYFAMRIADPPLITQVSRELKTNNYYDLEKLALAAISEHADKIAYQIDVGERFFRARIGFEKKMLTQSDNGKLELHHDGYSQADIGPPPPPIAPAGRLNRAGVSFFYLATDENTAISEVRPHPGHKVTVASFMSVKQIKVARLTPLDFYDFYETEELLNYYWLMNTLDKYFCMPITPEKRDHRYILSQIFSDAFRIYGFEGILYRSSVGTGDNLVVFDSEEAFRFEGPKCFSINRLEYSYTMLQEINEYEFNYDNENKSREPQDELVSVDDR